MSAIEKTVCDWVFSERERKLRRKESKIAWMLAFKTGIAFEPTGDGYYTDIHMELKELENDEQRAALALAVEAKRVYLAAAAKAGGLRAALSRATKERPAKNEAVWREFDALVRREEIAARADQAMVKP